MEIASLVIGTVDFSFGLFEIAISAFQVYTRASNFGKDAGIVQAQLLIQEQLLRRWGDGLGLTGSSEDIDERLQTETDLFAAVVAALSSIKNILLNVDTLKKRYGVEGIDDVASEGTLEQLRSLNLVEGLVLIREHTKRGEDAQASQKAISLLRKLRWSVTDKKKFGHLIAQLSIFVKGLYSLISPTDAKTIARCVAGELLRTTNLKRVREIRLAAPESGLGSDIAALAARRMRSIISSQDPYKIPNMSIDGGLENFKALQSPPGSRLAVGRYCGANETVEKSVVVEWKSVEPAVTGREKALLELRMNKLAYFLHQEKQDKGFTSLHCIGATGAITSADELKYGLVFELPGHTEPGKPPVSLYDVLPEDNEDDDNEYPELDLGDKFRLAQMLSETLHAVHVSNWLHKSIQSANVVFFPERSGTFFSANATYLTGYELARPGGRRDPTERAGSKTNFDVYRHPAYADGKAKYCRLFDIYSLGVVLLEIGLWRRLETEVEEDQSPENVRKMFVRACKNELGPAMGVLYREAVRCCLEGDFGVDGLTVDKTAEPDWSSMEPEEIAALEAWDEQVNGDLAESFYLRVVSPLGRLFVG